jgi:hypothetical protein
MVNRAGMLSVAVVVLFLVVPNAAFAGFGVKSLSTEFINQDGSPDVQAGSHPWAMKTDFELNIANAAGTASEGDLKDFIDELPAGFVGDPTATPKCTTQQFTTQRQTLLGSDIGESCPMSTQVGYAEVNVGGTVLRNIGVFNLVPTPNIPATFGFTVFGLKVLLTPSLRTGGDYGITVSVKDASQAKDVIGASIRLWGVPADPSHNTERIPDLECEHANLLGLTQGCSARAPLRVFLTMPSACSEKLTTVVHADSWQEPGIFQTVSAESVNSSGEPVGVVGCERLDFTPTVSVQPDTSVADTPTGLDVDVHIPQLVDPEGLAASTLRGTIVTLPRGVSVNPSTADGLEVCTPVEIGIKEPGPASCPDASKVGSVEIATPILEEPLKGSVYVAAQEDNPFNSLLALYVVAEAHGVLVKLAGKVEPNPVTGQLTTTFEENPQQPFSDLKLDFFGGPRAALVTPLTCGSYESTAVLTPWSGGLPVSSSSEFNITSGCGGGFAPSFAAGTSSNAGGTFSPFSATFSRSDTDEYLGGLAVKMPQGLLGTLAKVPICGEPQAQQGACPSASEIGHTTVGAGAGLDPIFLPQAGQPADPVYLTGPYKGAPFGLSIVVPAVAGPFNLGTVVVRAAINVDPRTAQITITSDPLPTILRGIPLQVKTVNVTVDRPGFTFNPTSCEPLKIESTITSTQGATASPSSPFHAVECAQLPFKPKLTATTEGKASANNGGNGASLIVSISSKGGPGVKGEEANIKKVDVQLPNGLSARLRTLQHACTEQQFAKNPAGCPKESDVGTAVANTPVLPVPLKGPVYFVSHGGKAFPEVIIVLQGDGVTLDLAGETLIKGKITYSHFQTVPDAPISSFKLTLPERKFSALASPAGNLCGKTLLMPTSIEGQNGIIIKQNTKLGVTGCHKKTTKTKKARKSKKS